MVTNADIVTEYNTVLLRSQEINKLLNALNRIRQTGPTQTVIPVNEFKYRDYTQAEIDSIHADCVTEKAAIKARM